MLGALRVKDLRRVDVGNLQHTLRDTPTQANRVVTVLSKMFNLAERGGLRADYTNPCGHLDRFREGERRGGDEDRGHQHDDADAAEDQSHLSIRTPLCTQRGHSVHVSFSVDGGVTRAASCRP
jgi:hypothetical protein